MCTNRDIKWATRMLIAAGVSLLAASADATTYTSRKPITPGTIPDTIVTSGISGVITKVKVTLHDVHIPDPSQLIIHFETVGEEDRGFALLELIENNGSFVPVTADHATITFDDFAAPRINTSQPLTSGTFRRTWFWELRTSGNDGWFPYFHSTYYGENPNREWRLWVSFANGSIGGWSVDIETAEPFGDPVTFTSASGLTISDSVAKASPYPLTLDVAGLDGLVIWDAEVTVTDFTMPEADDIDMLVEAPDSRAAHIYSDGGAQCASVVFTDHCTGTYPADHVTLTLSGRDADPPTGRWPYGPLLSGKYFPGDVDDDPNGGAPVDAFPSPVAGGRKFASMQTLRGAPANGAWKLFVHNDEPDFAGQSGAIASWTLTVYPGRPEPIAITPLSDITTTATPGQCTAPIDFSPFAKGSPTPTLLVVPEPGSLFPAGVTTVTITASNTVGSEQRTFQVTVNDLEHPALAVPANIVLNNDPNPLGTEVHYAFNVSDNCPGVTVNATPPSGSSFQVGTTLVTAFATDAAGNISGTVQFTVTIEDHTAPVITYQATPAISSAWVRHDVAIVVNATDAGGSGVTQLFCTGGSGFPFGTDTVSGIVTRDGETQLTCYAIDATGNERVLQLPPIRIDKTPPQITVLRSHEPNANGWNNTDLQVSFTVVEPHSGLLDADATEYYFAQEVSNQNLLFFARDRAGNCAAVIFGVASVTPGCHRQQFPAIKIDKTPPAVSLQRTPANANGWNNTDVTVRATATDAVSGIDGAPESEQVFTAEGTFPVAPMVFSDRAGNTTSLTPSVVKIDKTPPAIVNIEHLPAPNAAGWNRNTVTLHASVFDQGSAVSAAGFVRVIDAEGVFTIPFTVTDAAGNVGTHTFVVKTDWTPPTSQAARAFGAPNANGWDRTGVVINFTGHDAGSGVAPLGLPNTLQQVSFDTEGQNLTATGPALVDLAGNVGVPATLTGLNIDRTRPVVTKTRTPAANGNGWNNTDVAVHFQATDALSGIDGLATVDQVFTTEFNHTASQTFADLAGNTASANEINILIDKTAPAVTTSVLPPPNPVGWHNTTVNLQFTATDIAGGLNSGVDGVATVTTPISVEGQNLGASHTVTDRAGNSTTSQRFGINIDRTPPDVTITKTPAANAFGWNNSDVVVQFAAADGLAGIVGGGTAEVPVTGEMKDRHIAREFVDVAGNYRHVVAAVSIDRTAPMLVCAANPPFISPGSGLVPITLDVFFDDGDEMSYASRGPAYLRLRSIVSSAPQAGDIVDWTHETDDRSGFLLAPAASTPLVYTLIYEGSDLAGNLASCTMQVTVAHPATQVAQLSPNSAVAGSGADLPLVITGGGFVDGAVVRWNGATIPSSVVSANEMHATVPAASLATPGGVAVTVENPTPYDGAPGTGVFLVTHAPAPVTSMASGSSTPESPFVSLAAGAPGEGEPETLFVSAFGAGTIALAAYSTNPGTAFSGGGNFFDVFVVPGSTFETLTITTCALGGATELFWFSDQGWKPASHQTYHEASEWWPACIDVVVNAEGTLPAIGDLSGTYFAAGADNAPPVLTVPASVTLPATDATGAVVTFAATATDDTATTVVCTPSSGSLFAIGETTVNCTATDAVGLASSAAFRVTVTPPAPAGDLDGLMSGNGHLKSGKTTHRFEFLVYERGQRERARLEFSSITPGRNKRDRDTEDRFTDSKIESVVFSNDPAFSPGPRRGKRPAADSVVVRGTGRWNGKKGYTFELTATDQGEPGRGRDTFAIVIKDAKGKVVANVSGTLAGGNIQSTRLWWWDRR